MAVMSAAQKDESWIERAERIGCLHPAFLASAGKCEGCRHTPLSPRLAELEAKFDREG
jgi:hypothetical protein